MDKKTRQLFTVYGKIRLKFGIDRLYAPRKEGGQLKIVQSKQLEAYNTVFVVGMKTDTGNVD